VTTSTGHQLIKCISTHNDFVSSDHLPICLDLDIKNIQVHDYKETKRDGKIDWAALSAADFESYSSKCSNNLRIIPIANELLNCDNTMCQDIQHIKATDELYQSIIDALSSASKNIVSPSHKHSKSNQISGWNEYVKEVHSDAREAFIIWQSNSKPRAGSICELMRKTRARFKYCLCH